MTTKVPQDESTTGEDPEVINPTKVDPATTPREYSKLDKTVDYEHEPVEELADALNELVAIEDRARYLREIIQENKALHPFIWTTAEGIASPLHKLESDHFGNILIHLVERGSTVSKALRSEARRRGIVVPQARGNKYQLSRSNTNTISMNRNDDIARLYANTTAFNSREKEYL